MHIANGTLSIGDPLPSVRSLAKSLSISTLSVQRAFSELSESGIIETTVGKGTFVNQSLNKSHLREAMLSAIENDAVILVSQAKQNQIELNELLEIIKILWEEENE